MTISVTMSKDEFIDYTKFNDYKQKVKSLVVDLNEIFNSIYSSLLEDGLLTDKNKYGKIMNNYTKVISKLEEGTDRK